MTRVEVLNRLQEIFNATFIEPIHVTEALTAREVPEWDSLSHISLVVAVEKGFKIRFRVGEVEKTKNVGDFVDLILKRQQDHVS